MSRRQSLRDFRRRAPVRKPRLRILIVSEGEKTEGLYFSLFVRALKAANVQVDILGRECGSDPLTVVDFAAEKFKADRGYDICYCVIDRDEHPLVRFNAALQKGQKIDNINKSRDFKVIVSDPCIEFWFILHFAFCRSPFVRKGDKSPGECAIEELKKYLPDYKKSSLREIEKLLSETEKAIKNSRKACDDAVKTGDVNPSTSMHNLVERVLSEVTDQSN